MQTFGVLPSLKSRGSGFQCTTHSVLRPNVCVASGRHMKTASKRERAAVGGLLCAYLHAVHLAGYGVCQVVLPSGKCGVGVGPLGQEAICATNACCGPDGICGANKWRCDCPACVRYVKTKFGIRKVRSVQTLSCETKAADIVGTNGSAITVYCPAGCQYSATTPVWGTGPSFAYSPPCALISHAQRSSGVVDGIPLAWRGHTKSTTARSGPSPDLAVWLE